MHPANYPVSTAPAPHREGSASFQPQTSSSGVTAVDTERMSGHASVGNCPVLQSPPQRNILIRAAKSISLNILGFGSTTGAVIGGTIALIVASPVTFPLTCVGLVATREPESCGYAPMISMFAGGVVGYFVGYGLLAIPAAICSAPLRWAGEAYDAVTRG